MWLTSLFQRRTATRQQLARISDSWRQRRSWRPQLERLEDRIVPALADGTILVCTGPSSFSTQDQSSFASGLVAVDPVTGQQAPLSTGGLFSLPTYIAEGTDGMLYVTDIGQLDSDGNPVPNTGAIIRVDPNRPDGDNQSLVASGLNGPNTLVFRDGLLYVALTGDSSGLVHTIVQVNPNTLEQRAVSDDSGGGFSVPTGIAAAPGNNLYVVDEPGNVQGEDPGSIWMVNLDTGQQTRLSHGGLLDHPQDIAVAANGDLIVGNTGSALNGYAGSVIRLDGQTYDQSLISSFGEDTGLNSLDLAADGTIFIGAISSGPTPGVVYSVDPATGGQAWVTAGGYLSLVEGIRVFHTPLASASSAVLDTPEMLVDSSVRLENHVCTHGNDTFWGSDLRRETDLLTAADSAGPAVTAERVTTLFGGANRNQPDRHGPFSDVGMDLEQVFSW